MLGNFQLLFGNVVSRLFPSGVIIAGAMRGRSNVAAQVGV